MEKQESRHIALDRIHLYTMFTRKALRFWFKRMLDGGCGNKLYKTLESKSNMKERFGAGQSGSSRSVAGPLIRRHPKERRDLLKKFVVSATSFPGSDHSCPFVQFPDAFGNWRTKDSEISPPSKPSPYNKKNHTPRSTMTSCSSHDATRTNRWPTLR